MNSQQDEEDSTVDAEVLFNILTDSLVKDREYLPFLAHLFSATPGIWIDLAALSVELPQLKAALLHLREAEPAAQHTTVTWLPYPDTGFGPGFCVIVFFCAGTYWSDIIIFNKWYFEEEVYPT